MMSALTKNFVIPIPVTYLDVALWLIQRVQGDCPLGTKGRVLCPTALSPNGAKSLYVSAAYQVCMFFTFTCAQKDFPGTSNLHLWKSSKEWASSIPDYQSMSEIEHKEVSNSIKELYSVISF
jgi:hypothetical protein